MFKIQSLTVKNPTSLKPSVELTIADAPSVDEATAYLTASVTIDRQWVSFETIELSALDEILELVQHAKAGVKATTDAIQKLGPR